MKTLSVRRTPFPPPSRRRLFFAFVKRATPNRERPNDHTLPLWLRFPPPLSPFSIFLLPQPHRPHRFPPPSPRVIIKPYTVTAGLAALEARAGVGPNHPDVADLCMDLGRIHLEDESLKKAVYHFERAWRTYKVWQSWRDPHVYIHLLQPHPHDMTQAASYEAPTRLRSLDLLTQALVSNRVNSLATRACMRRTYDEEARGKHAPETLLAQEALAMALHRAGEHMRADALLNAAMAGGSGRLAGAV